MRTTTHEDPEVTNNRPRYIRVAQSFSDIMIYLQWLQKYLEDLIRPIYAKVGFDAKPGDEHLDVLMRSLVVSWGCNIVGLPECSDKAVAQWKQWMDRDAPDSEGNNP